MINSFNDDVSFRSHPVFVNYEASRNGIVRHRKYRKSVEKLNNMGYFRVGIGGKNYYIHRIVYECYNGLIEDNLVIDHIDGCRQNNKLENLQAITQRDNLSKGNISNSKSVGKNQYSHLTQ